MSGAPVFLPAGDPGRFPALLAETGPPPALDLHVRTEALPAVRERYVNVRTRRLLRMSLERSPVGCADLAWRPVLLTLADLPDIQRLYADGESTSESPDFFFPSMLGDNTFFGIREGDDLIAIGGTHLVSDTESVAAIGNVYTRRDHRGRGLGAATTRAVIEALQLRGIGTIALSVIATNTAAIRVYERLGFTVHCEFFDGAAAVVS